MECPYCKYVFEKVDDGEKEESFYVMPIKNRGSGQYYSEVVTQTVCKKCEKSFYRRRNEVPTL